MYSVINTTIRDTLQVYVHACDKSNVKALQVYADIFCKTVSENFAIERNFRVYGLADVIHVPCDV